MELGPLERLDDRHDLSRFDAGPADLEGQAEWLRTRGLANDRAGFTRVLVTTHAGTSRVCAFFGLAPGSIAKDALPRRLRRYDAPRTVPVILIARLAVDQTLQGGGVGRGMMLEALDRALRGQEHVGAALVVVDAAGEKAQRFYAHHKFTPIAAETVGAIRMAVQMETAAELLGRA